MTHQIRVNGQPEPLAAPTLDALLRAKGVDPAARGVAVALNGQVVPVRHWTETALKSGDELEIVRPFSGG
jgi:sulfur carrier protein